MAAAVAAAAGLAGPAMAGGRPIQSDDPATPALSFTPCTLGVTGCAGIGAYSPEFVGRFSDTGDTTLYIYKEGVVSVGAELPDGASVAGGTASLGTGTWFAPSFGAPIDVTAFNDPVAPGQFRINWSNGGDTLFQFFILDDAFDDPTTAVIGLNGDVQPGSVIAYNYTPVDWVPPDGFTPPSIDPNTDPIFLDVPSSFNTGLPGPSDPGSTGTGSVTPEPASWALMLVGFGALGAALRRRRRTTALAA
ncbi:MAG TPA: PEPxxWA-CTERM sorting domain-containing protein [Phenylobacterium sp.]|jgi:hypothetical protein